MLPDIIALCREVEALQSRRAFELTSWRVGDAAKNPRNEGAELIAASKHGELF